MPPPTKSAKEIFLEAAERADSSSRARYLDEACGDNAELRRHVEALLRVHDQPDSLLDQERIPAPLLMDREAAPPTTDQPLERPGTQIGPYKLLQQIGEGGMGVVFMAEQNEPVRRRVALKIIKPGMDTRQVIARFEAERQALSLMDHPNIARVLDAGTTGSGRPYFVMELVKGQPITQYCDEHHLTPRQRLELLLPVCQAIQHAHQKGIIHRDIKPTNILVAEYDQKAVPKVIDFGVAKATSQALTEKTMFTGFGQIVGTLEYMSPEQAKVNQLDIDTRSDIYSLGVLLYELLTGSTPFDKQRLRSAAFDEMLRIIREEEPEKPSTRLESRSRLPDGTSASGSNGESGSARQAEPTLASLAALRHTEPAKLTKLVRGELDWIVMKALEKDRNRRYETATALAADLQHYLSDEPVVACPPSAMYRFRKFARRNKRGLASAAVLALAVLAVAGTLGWAIRDRDAHALEVTRERASREAAIQGEVNLALKEVELMQEQAKWPEALSAAKRAEGLLAGGGSGEVRERVQNVRKDLELVLRLEELRARWGDHPGHESQNRDYARVFANFDIDVTRLGPAEAAARIRRRPGIAIRVAAGLDEWAMVLRDWPVVHPDQQHDPAIWKGLIETARLADPDPWRSELRQLMVQEDLNGLRKLADSSNIAALPVQSLQHMGNALVFGGDAPACVAWLRKAHRQHPGDVLISFDLAFHLSNLPSADRLDVLRFAEAALAARPQSASMYNMVGTSLDKLGRRDEAIACFQKAIELKPNSAEPYCTLGVALTESGRVDEAIACFQKAIELKPDHAWAHIHLGISLDRKGRQDEAIAAFHKAIDLKPDETWVHSGLGWVLGETGRYDEAVAACRKAIELKPDFAWPHRGLGVALYRQGKVDEALAAYRKAIELNPQYIGAHIDLGNALLGQKKLDEALVNYQKVSELSPENSQVHVDIGNALRNAGNLDEAIVFYNKAIKLAPHNSFAQHDLGWTLHLQHKYDEAIVRYHNAIELRPEIFHAHVFLGHTLMAQNKPDDAIAAFRKAAELNPNGPLTHLALGNALLGQKKLDEALVNYQKVSELSPKNSQVHVDIGNALRNAGNLDEAIVVYNKAIELGPDNASAHHDLGWALHLQGKNDEAIVCFRKAIELWPENFHAYYFLGHTLTAQQKPDEAIVAFRKATKHNPDATHAHIALGNALCAQRQLDEAIIVFNKAIELKPDNWEGWSGRAVVHFSQQQWEQAAADYSEAIRLAPEVHANWWHRGHSYLNLAQWDKAAADFGKAVEDWPDGGEGWYLRGVALGQLGQLDKAMDDLQEAKVRGFLRLEYMTSDPRFDPLRSREDFRELLNELEQNEKSKNN